MNSQEKCEHICTVLTPEYLLMPERELWRKSLAIAQADHELAMCDFHFLEAPVDPEAVKAAHEALLLVKVAIDEAIDIKERQHHGILEERDYAYLDAAAAIDPGDDLDDLGGDE